jgi:hypothetical protein
MEVRRLVQNAVKKALRPGATSDYAFTGRSLARSRVTGTVRRGLQKQGANAALVWHVLKPAVDEELTAVLDVMKKTFAASNTKRLAVITPPAVEEIVSGSWRRNQFGYGSVREHKVGPDEVLDEMRTLSPQPTATVIVTATTLDWGASPHWKNLVIVVLSADVKPTVLQEVEESAPVGTRIIGFEALGTPGD